MWISTDFIDFVKKIHFKRFIKLLYEKCNVIYIYKYKFTVVLILLPFVDESATE